MLAMYARAESVDKALPQPKNFPVSLDDALKLILPQKRHPDRMKIFREWLRENIRSGNYMEKYRPAGKTYEDTPVPTDDEVAKDIVRDRKDGLSQFWFNNVCSGIRRWLPEDRK